MSEENKPTRLSTIVNQNILDSVEKEREFFNKHNSKNKRSSFNSNDKFKKKYKSKTSTQKQSPDEPVKNKYSAKSYAVYLLSRRDYATSELLDKLKLKEYPQTEIEDAISWVQELGYQSDERYANIQSKIKSRVAGNKKISMQLKQKKISEELVEESINALEPEEDRAYDALSRFRGKPMDLKAKQKAYRFLLSRGFSFDSIKIAWTKVFLENLDSYNDE